MKETVRADEGNTTCEGIEPLVKTTIKETGVFFAPFKDHEKK